MAICSLYLRTATDDCLDISKMTVLVKNVRNLVRHCILYTVVVDIYLYTILPV